MKVKNVGLNYLNKKEKDASRIFLRFEKTIPQWQTFIETSFLSDELKKKYSRLIVDRWRQL